jgi:hypothetical protein
VTHQKAEELALQLVTDYLREQGEDVADFALEYEGLEAESGYLAVAAVHRSDQGRDPAEMLGSAEGKSLAVRVDLNRMKVVSALGEQ